MYDFFCLKLPIYHINHRGLEAEAAPLGIPSLIFRLSAQLNLNLTNFILYSTSLRSIKSMQRTMPRHSSWLSKLLPTKKHRPLNSESHHGTQSRKPPYTVT